MTEVKSFLAIVHNVYPTNSKLLPKDNRDTVAIFNNNQNFSEEDARLYGAITYEFENTFDIEDYAFPFDKNNFTFPIKGETVIILKMFNQTFWLPYTNTPYSNYRRDEITYVATRPVDTIGNDKSGGSYTSQTRTGGKSTSADRNENIEYNINEKIKFINPKQGDTIISGRVGNTIRFSEFHLTEDGKTPSPSIFIRNKQNPELDLLPIGTLVNEDVNKDGTSIYITSNKVKVPFKETIKKQKIAFVDYPNSKDLSGDQLFVNSDRIVLSAKAKEFIIFGKSNTGIITDGKFSVDSIGDSHIHSDNNIIFQTKKNIVLSTDGIGNIWLGEVKKTSGKAGEDVQRAVLGGELIALMEEMLDAINKMVFATGVGPTGPGPHNAAIFTSIKKRLSKIQSSRTFLSK